MGHKALHLVPPNVLDKGYKGLQRPIQLCWLFLLRTPLPILLARDPRTLARVYLVSSSFKNTGDPPLWTALLTQESRGQAFTIAAVGNVSIAALLTTL